jgi:ATP-dependent DNA helicase RecQ
LKQIQDQTVRRQTKAKTEKIYSLCQSSACRRKEILRYFGERYEPTHCEGCDQCLDDTDLIDISLPAQKILSCVYRLEEKYGIKYLIDVLRGTKSKPIFEKGHDKLSTFNLMPECSEEELRALIFVLIEKGYLERTEGDYPVVKWTPLSRQLVRGETRVSMRKKIEPKLAKRKKTVDFEYNRHLFEELSKLRKKLADEAKVPAFVVFGDKSLMEMCCHYPKTDNDFLKINGVSTGKLEKYGTIFLNAIKEYCDKNGKKSG